MKKLFLIVLVILLLISKFDHKAYAIYDPQTKQNNKFGIHILFPSEIKEAADLVNSTSGDWGYVTIPMQATDKDLIKWQNFMNDCRKYHIIPIIRIATTSDYFNKGSWTKPDNYDLIDFANFLNDLNWPTKNRYVVIFNETNRSDEWGGSVNASEYAQILSDAIDIFHEKNSDFFIVSAGLDNASANTTNAIEEFNYMQQMENAVPGIFAKLDGLGSHSYPNPGFSMPPSNKKEGIYSFYYQNNLVNNLSGKQLPVFITETGWSSNKISQEVQSQYYIQSFTNYWNDNNIIAVTPFILNAPEGSFAQFSFLKLTGKNKIYYAYFNYPKIKGEPELTNIPDEIIQSKKKIPTKNFKNAYLNNIFKTISIKQKEFLKWFLGI